MILIGGYKGKENAETNLFRFIIKWLCSAEFDSHKRRGEFGIIFLKQKNNKIRKYFTTRLLWKAALRDGKFSKYFLGYSSQFLERKKNIFTFVSIFFTNNKKFNITAEKQLNCYKKSHARDMETRTTLFFKER